MMTSAFDNIWMSATGVRYRSAYTVALDVCTIGPCGMYNVKRVVNC